MPKLCIGSHANSCANIATLCKLAFHLSGEVLVLHINNSTAEAYVYNLGGRVSILA